MIVIKLYFYDASKLFLMNNEFMHRKNYIIFHEIKTQILK